MFHYCPLYSGSSGNSALIAGGGVRLLVDAGLSGKAIVSALQSVGQDPAKLDGILITHEHSDHIKGAGVLSRKYNLPIYANADTWAAMRPKIGEIAPQNIRIFSTGHDFFLGQLGVLPYSISHDAADPVAFSFSHGSLRIAQLTDLGHVTREVIEVAGGADLVLLEANHDPELLAKGSYPAQLKRRILSRKGHLSNDAAAALCCDLCDRGSKRFILGHLSGENNNETLAFNTVKSALQQYGCSVCEDGDVQLYMAHRDRTSDVFILKSDAER